MLTAETFLAAVEDYLARSGMSATAFGMQSVGDPSLVRDLRAGRAPNLRLVEKINQYIADHPAAAEPERAAS